MMGDLLSFLTFAGAPELIAFVIMVTSVFQTVRVYEQLRAEAADRERLRAEVDLWRHRVHEMPRGAEGMNGRRPEITAGTVEVMTIRIHCPYCDAVYMAENGDPIVRDTDESFHALPRTLVCKACMCRFVKPTPLGWGRHYTGAKLRPTERKPQPTPGMGATRPGASQTPIAGRTAVRSLDMAIETIRAARSMLRRP